MAAQGMAFRQARVVKIVAEIVRHAQFFHHSARAQILRNGEGDKAVEAIRLDAKSLRKLKTLRGYMWSWA